MRSPWNHVTKSCSAKPNSSHKAPLKVPSSHDKGDRLEMSWSAQADQANGASLVTGPKAKSRLPTVKETMNPVANRAAHPLLRKIALRHIFGEPAVERYLTTKNSSVSQTIISITETSSGYRRPAVKNKRSRQ